MRKQIKIAIILTVSLLVALCLTAGALLYFQVDFLDRSGWEALPEGQHYLDYYGRPQTGWVEIDGEKHYFDPETALLRSGWLEIDGVRCYLTENGTLHTGWLEAEEGRYYLTEDGTPHIGWLDTDGKRYYLNEAGLLHTGWLEADQQKYYFDPDGALHYGWLDVEEGRFYMTETGTPHIGWLDTETGRYYLNEAGNPHSGWLDADGDRYYLDSEGLLQTGWLEQEGERYYLRSDGRMAKGKITLEGVNYFFTSTGKYLPVVNYENPVPEDYEADLVSYNGYRVDASCLDALKEMMAACRAAGYSVKINSAYRSAETQKNLWNKRYNNYRNSGLSDSQAKAKVAASVAKPGTSEHQLGLAVDLGGSTAMYRWLAEHSWEYGFHLRYPEGKTEETGIIYEPWHFRYLGKELAQELYELDLTVEEYMETLTEE